MRKTTSRSIRLKNISIKNYKGIDSFTMEFPIPTLDEDPDILVMGSENGLGKSSIIECCALQLMCLSTKDDMLFIKPSNVSLDLPELLIRAGAEDAEISGEIEIGDKVVKIGMKINQNGWVNIFREEKHLDLFEDIYNSGNIDVLGLVAAIIGFSPNPVLESSFLLFHSYRKVQEGNPELGKMELRQRDNNHVLPLKHTEMPFSKFKLRILRSLMIKAGLFEIAKGKEPADTIEKLNELVKFYVGGTISKLRPSVGNTVDFRITPVNGSESLTFDALSSGQKEIISTLFLIWYHTRNSPSVVFIDEPELHLNAQWHRSFVNKLINLAPQNQYVVATHSEDIMDSVAEDRRILLFRE